MQKNATPNAKNALKTPKQRKKREIKRNQKTAKKKQNNITYKLSAMRILNPEKPQSRYSGAMNWGSR